jgi:hypothetical protein
MVGIDSCSHAGKLAGLRKRPLLMDLAVSLLMIAVSFFGMIWLLLFWFGEGHARTIVPYTDAAVLADIDASDLETSGPFIPMPDHLRTNDEMVTWMTHELPKLTAAMPNPRM